MRKLGCLSSSTKHISSLESTKLTTKEARNVKELIIAFLNVRTLRTVERETEYIHAIGDTRFDVIGLREVRSLGEAIIRNKWEPIQLYRRNQRSKRSWLSNSQGHEELCL